MILSRTEAPEALPELILLLLPGSLPGSGAMRQWAAADLLADASGEASRRRRTRQLDFAGVTGRLAGLPWFETAHGETGVDAHDTYFRVQRVDADPPGAFLRTLLTARLVVAREAACAVSEATQPLAWVMDQALCSLLDALLDIEAGPLPPLTPGDAPPSGRDPLRRWICGHQIFASLTQGLVVCCESLRGAIRSGAHAEARQWTSLGIQLLNGSAAAFEFTGDCSAEEYEQLIRPTMAPPHTPVCLSGLMSADHRYLAQLMRDMRPAFRSLASAEPELHRAFAEALACVYDRHILVCEQFVGNQPSLLSAGRTEKSGPAVIAQFKALRQKPFEHQPKADRLEPAPAQCLVEEQTESNQHVK